MSEKPARRYKRPLRCRNLEKFQHYKNRRPPWIKLYRELIDDPDYYSMSAEARAHLPLLWILISESDDGVLEGDPERLAFRLRRNAETMAEVVENVVSAGFFCDLEPADNHGASGALAGRYHGASTALAERYHGASAEGEGEGEERESREPDEFFSRVCSDPSGANAPGARASSFSKQGRRNWRREVLAVYRHWQSYPEHAQATPPERLTPSMGNYKTILARLRAGYSVKQLKLAVDGNRTEHNLEHGHTGIDTVMRASKVDRYIENGAQAQSAEAKTVTTQSFRDEASRRGCFVSEDEGLPLSLFKSFEEMCRFLDKFSPGHTVSPDDF